MKNLNALLRIDRIRDTPNDIRIDIDECVHEIFLKKELKRLKRLRKKNGNTDDDNYTDYEYNNK